MATPTSTCCCITNCKKAPAVTCLGCPNLSYCSAHYKQHRHDLNTELHKLIDQCNQFHEQVEIQGNNPQANTSIQTINEWENRSITKIRKLAQETREKLLAHVNDFIPEVKVRLEVLRTKLHQDPDECEFVDTDIKNWTVELERLKSILINPPDLNVREAPTEFVTKIYLDVERSTRHRVETAATGLSQARTSIIPSIPVNSQWKQNGVTIAGGNGEGSASNQIDRPFRLFVYNDRTMIIVEHSNHRISQWEKGDMNGQVIAGGNGQGNQLNQLNWPTDALIDKETDSVIVADRSNRRIMRWSLLEGTKQGEILVNNISCWGLAMDNQRYLYVSNDEKHEVRRYRLGDTNGTLVAGGNDHGSGLSQLKEPRYLCLDQQRNLYISEWLNHRVMKWSPDAKEGIVIAGGLDYGGDLAHLSHPQGIFVDALGTLYVADAGNHRVMRWTPGNKKGTQIVGGNGEGTATNQLNYPWNLTFDRHGNLYVLDQNNARIQQFSIE